MAKPGRPRKPTATLKLTGHYRADRHAGRDSARLTTGVPRMPGWLHDREAKDLWRAIAPALFANRIACREDAAALGMLCRWFATWRKADRRLRLARDDKTQQAALRTARAAAEECNRLFGRFGLTPADRAALKIEKPDENKDAFKFDAG